MICYPRTGQWPYTHRVTRSEEFTCETGQKNGPVQNNNQPRDTSDGLGVRRTSPADDRGHAELRHWDNAIAGHSEIRLRNVSVQTDVTQEA